MTGNIVRAGQARETFSDAVSGRYLSRTSFCETVRPRATSRAR